MPLRLIIALTLSLVLHGSLLITAWPQPSPALRAPALKAFLRPLPEPEPARPPETPDMPDPLLKNTIMEEAPARSTPQPAHLPRQSGPARTAAISKSERLAVQRKLSEYVFYPEQARAMGIEGTVVLFVDLSREGRVEDVRVVSSSGFPILDNAAIKGFYAVGRLPGKSDTWSYTFHLE